MKSIFNQKVERKNSYSVKWIKQKHEDSITFCVADSDYFTTPEVMKQLTYHI